MVSALPTNAAAVSAGSGSGGKPGYLPPAGTMERLRERRRLRTLWRDVYDGKWSEVLLDCQRTQHKFREMERYGGKIGALLVKANLVRLALLLMADVVANRPVTLSVPEENAEQKAALDAIRDRCLFDGQFHEAVLTVFIESEAMVGVDVAPGPDGQPVTTLRLESNDVVIPVGPPDRAAGNQPSAFERRWIIERPDPTDSRKKLSFLRVERHRVIGGAGVVEQEAYRGKNKDGRPAAIIDTLVGLETLERVPLAAAIAPGNPIPEEIARTGVQHPLLTQLVAYRLNGQPEFRLTESDIGLIDQGCATMSQLARAIALHASPQRRVPESAMDAKGGPVNIDENVVDPDKQFEYIQLTMQFESMLDFIDRALGWLMAALSVNPGLLGLQTKTGSPADTAAKLRVQSTATLAAAQRSVPHIRSALERLWTTASMVDAQRGTTGYAVAPVGVKIHPELPTTFRDRVDDQAAALEAKLTSRIDALRQVHGEGDAPARLAEIESDEDAATKRAAASLSASFGGPLNTDGAEDTEIDPGGRKQKEPEPIPTGAAA